MSTAAIARPHTSEYAAYYETYVSLVPDGDIVGTFERQLEETLSLIRGIPETRGEFRYAEGKWSIKELIGHIIDCERVFAYRALRFGRGDTTPLSGFEQDDFVRGADFNKRSLENLADEYELVRRSTIALFGSLEADAWDRRGTANDNEVSVRGLAFITAGHERHHLGVLKNRYL